jgi:hypothetical protein
MALAYRNTRRGRKQHFFGPFPNKMPRTYWPRHKSAPFRIWPQSRKQGTIQVKFLRIQSGCVVGTIAGRDLCENQEQVAEIVLHLQAKVDQQRKSKSCVIMFTM